MLNMYLEKYTFFLYFGTTDINHIYGKIVYLLCTNFVDLQWGLRNEIYILGLILKQRFSEKKTIYRVSN